MSAKSSDPSTDSDERKPGILLRTHRSTVESTHGMSTAVLLGSSFALAMGLFTWLGHRWDLKHDTEPWGVLTGVCLAFLYGWYEVWKIIRISEDVSERSVKGEVEGGSRPESGGNGS